MHNKKMTSMERVLTALSHREPDRVPVFLLATMHGAKELGLTIKEYFSRPENVVEGQLRLMEKLRNDCIYSFFYAAIEIEAFGGSVIFSEDGPPVAGEPVIKALNIKELECPKIKDAKVLHKVLSAIKELKAKVNNEVPVIGVAISPFSLPVMQLGFENYLDIMHFQPALLDRLLKINEQFCTDWANAQLDAGATAICYFDPVSSTTIIPREKYLETGFLCARRTLAGIHGPTATHFASGNCLSIIEDVAQTGTSVVGVSSMEDLGKLKAACRNRLTILGNLNGIEMRRWTKEEARENVINTIRTAAPGGGFILADNHGEIPFSIPDEVLYEISETVHTHGTYPLIAPSEEDMR